MPRRSKRIKLLHEQKSPTSVRELSERFYDPDSNSDGIEMCGSWLPDGVCFHIFSYLSNGNIIANRYADGVSSLAYSIRLVSKDASSVLRRYLRNAPLKMIVRYRDHTKQTKRRIEWACKNQVNLVEFLFDVPYLNNDGKRKMDEFKRILEACRTDKVQRFGLVLPMYNNLRQSFQLDDKSPELEFQRYVINKVPKPNPNYQPFNASINASGIKKLCLAFHQDELHLPLLKRYSNTVEELEIRVCRFAKVRPNVLVLEGLSMAIKDMSRLQKLKICNYGKFGAASIHISSESLKYLDMLNCDDEFYVESLVCPSLESMEFKHRIEGASYQALRNGLRLQNEEGEYLGERPFPVNVAVDMNTFENFYGARLKGIELPIDCMIGLRM